MNNKTFIDIRRISVINTLNTDNLTLIIIDQGKEIAIPTMSKDIPAGTTGIYYRTHDEPEYTEVDVPNVDIQRAFAGFTIISYEDKIKMIGEYQIPIKV